MDSGGSVAIRQVRTALAAERELVADGLDLAVQAGDRLGAIGVAQRNGPATSSARA
ncbi:MAG: hypothetical protein R3F11_29165 [Verrucomicrobiales bacterium]